MKSWFEKYVIILGVLFVLLLGCSSNAEDKGSKNGSLLQNKVTDVSSIRAAKIDPSTFAGRIQIKLDSSIKVRDTAIPLSVLAGLEEAGPTRLRLRAFVDLRDLQLMAPEVLTGPLEETCNRQIYITVRNISVDGDAVRIDGTTRAQFTRCNRRQEPGLKYFGTTVDAVAVGKAKVKDQCLHFSLDALELDPHGIVGGAANLFGFTNRIKAAVLEKTRGLLAANPVCPPLPNSFSVLDPDYESGGTREIVPGGMGGEIVGSVDVSAGTLVTLLAGLQERGVLRIGK